MQNNSSFQSQFSIFIFCVVQMTNLILPRLSFSNRISIISPIYNSGRSFYLFPSSSFHIPLSLSHTVGEECKSVFSKRQSLVRTKTHQDVTRVNLNPLTLVTLDIKASWPEEVLDVTRYDLDLLIGFAKTLKNLVCLMEGWKLWRDKGREVEMTDGGGRE